MSALNSPKPSSHPAPYANSSSSQLKPCTSSQNSSSSHRNHCDSYLKEEGPQKLKLFERQSSSQQIYIYAELISEPVADKNWALKIVKEEYEKDSLLAKPYLLSMSIYLEEQWLNELAFELASTPGNLLYALLAQFHTESALDSFMDFCDLHLIPYEHHVQLSSSPESYY